LKELNKISQKKKRILQLDTIQKMLQMPIPPFLYKLYAMVEDKGSDAYISWSSNSAFTIHDLEGLVDNVLPSKVLATHEPEKKIHCLH